MKPEDAANVELSGIEDLELRRQLESFIGLSDTFRAQLQGVLSTVADLEKTYAGLVRYLQEVYGQSGQSEES